VLPLRRRRPLESVHIMCAKRQRRCAVLLALREEPLQEWIVAETYSDVCRAWGASKGALPCTATAGGTSPSWRRPPGAGPDGQESKGAARAKRADKLNITH
jgi:hypothetical protein